MSFQRTAGFCGLAGLAMWALAFILIPAPPLLGASATEVAEFATDNRNALVLSTYLLDVLPAFAFLVLGVGLWHATRAEPGWSAAVLGSTFLLSTGLLGWALVDILFIDQADRAADPSAFLVTFDLYQAIHLPVHAAFAFLAVTYTMATRRLGTATTLGTAAAVIAIVNLVVMSVAYVRSDALEAVHIAAIFGFLAWLGVMAVRLIRSEQPEAYGPNQLARTASSPASLGTSAMG